MKPAPPPQVPHPDTEAPDAAGDRQTQPPFAPAGSCPAPCTEVRNLRPATTYAFRVCAWNAAGAGSWSAPAAVTTPPAAPAPVGAVSSSAAATEVTLRWAPPECHGDPITHYVVETGDHRPLVTAGPVPQLTVGDLAPETSYK